MCGDQLTASKYGCGVTGYTKPFQLYSFLNPVIPQKRLLTAVISQLWNSTARRCPDNGTYIVVAPQVTQCSMHYSITKVQCCSFSYDGRATKMYTRGQLGICQHLGRDSCTCVVYVCGDGYIFQIAHKNAS